MAIKIGTVKSYGVYLLRNFQSVIINGYQQRKNKLQNGIHDVFIKIHDVTLIINRK